jgi:NhaP-type Na+/H+ or K+/H+ antiporter
MMLFLFLPVLIFGEAMTLKWHHVKGGIAQALLLAGPGVVIGAFMMGSFVFLCLPDLGWSWNLCMVFGSILAATDPVAVVALLKSAGASPKLTILIIGESLLNDGTAMVLFSLFFDMVKGDVYNGEEIFAYFVKMAIGSPVFGACVGMVSVYALSLANKPLNGDDVTVQIAITVCCAYMTFFMAEYELRMSGLLACCGAGAAFSCFAPPLILEHETMHHVWGMIEWAGNTLIFLLAGLIIGSETIHEVTPSDWGYLFLLFLVLLIIRVIIIALLYPVLSRVGLKCSQNDAIFMSWAGLRGALGMALALIVNGERNEEHLHKSDTDRLFFFVGGIAALTLIINATSSRFVLEKLGLLKLDTPDKVLVMEQIKKRLRGRLMKQVKHLQKDLHIEDMTDITKHNTLLTSPDEVHRSNSKAERTLSVPHERSFSKRNSTSAVMGDLLAYVRTVFLEIVRVEYWKRIEDGRLPRQAYATQTLLYSIDNALDRVHKTRLRDWKWLNYEMQTSLPVAYFAYFVQKYCSPTSRLHTWLDIVESRNEEFRVYVLSNFIESHEAAQKKIFRFMGEEDGENDVAYRTPETSMVLNESQHAVSPLSPYTSLPVYLTLLCGVVVLCR